MIPALFYQNEDLNIAKDIKGYFLLPNSAIDSLYEAYQVYEDEKPNPTFLTYYNSTTRKYYFQYRNSFH